MGELGELHRGDDDVGNGVDAVNCGDGLGQSGEGGDLDA